ncbi:hypothetical protein JCM5353_000112 [Sporobolomyces roseus]
MAKRSPHGPPKNGKSRHLLDKHQREFCPIVNGELDEKVWKRKGGKIIRKNAIQDTHVDTDPEEDAIGSDDDEYTENQHFGTQQRSSPAFVPRARTRSPSPWLFPPGFDHLGNYPDQDSDDARPDWIDTASHELSPPPAQFHRHTTTLHAEETLRRQESHDYDSEPEPMTNAPIVPLNDGEAGYEELKAERTMNPLELHASPTRHPSNPAHHGNRHRRDSTGLHLPRHPPQNSLSKPLSLRQSRRYKNASTL